MYMKFKNIGEKGKPVAVLIHAMFFSENMFYDLAKLLKETHYVILPTLDAHSLDENTTFYSVKNEADKIICYLLENDIRSVDILLGVSLGGIIAFEMFRQHKTTIEHVFLDGTPFLRFPKVFIKMIGTGFKCVAHKSAKMPTQKNVIDRLFPGNSAEIKQICGNMNDESITNLAFACYSYKLPKQIEVSPHQTLTFIYSSREKARFSIPFIIKYTNCQRIIKKSYRHCEFLEKEPQAYIKMMQTVIKGVPHDKI